jgi:hypothetical protein
MLFDFSGADVMLAYLRGEATADEVLAHPAYRAVQRHSAHYGPGVTPEDLDTAKAGRTSPFYGLDHLEERIARSESTLAVVRQRASRWVGEAKQALGRVLPAETTDTITIYPIIGYDAGVGLDEAVCMNVSYSGYTEEPEEFLYFVIHECVHVLYERHHALPRLSQVRTQEQWRSFFNLFLQNEGFAVYVPFALRSARGHLADRDYKVLTDPAAIDAHLQALHSVRQKLTGPAQLTADECSEICFGPKRLTYRVGCYIIGQIERQHGLSEVRRAFYCSGDDFWTRYSHLAALAATERESHD